MCSNQFSGRSEWLVLLVLGGIQFTHILDFMILMPLGPELINRFDISDGQFGLLVSAYSFAAGVSGLLACLYIDSVERKRLLLVLFACFGVATVGCGMANSYSSLMSARLAAGLFGGVLTGMVQTMVADLIPYERRGKAMGFVMTAFSVSSVLGVPVGLYIATLTNWQVPFWLIGALVFVLLVIAVFSLPQLRGHLNQQEKMSAVKRVQVVFSSANHWLGFLLSFSLVFAGFSVIPYITLYLQANAGVPEIDIPLIYLVGGAATIVTAQFIGRCADRYGKVQVLRVVGTVAVAPISLLPFAEYFSWPVILVISTLFFVFVSGRMIPGMALLTATVTPHLRGTFMTLNSSVQSAGMGLAALVGGLIISRDTNGAIQYYWVCSLVALVSNFIALWVAGRLRLQ